MKWFLSAVVLVIILSSQVQGVLISEGPYVLSYFENHRDAYISWRQAHEKGIIQEGMTLVHIDAHHDMDCVVGLYYEQWLFTYPLHAESVQGVTNATFIDAAVNEGLITDIWWVMPDYLYWGEHFDEVATFTSQGEPRQFYKYVRFCDCEIEEGHVVCTLMDIHDVAPPLTTLDRYEKTQARVHFVTLEMLPSFEEEILLDIDTDYFANSMDVERYPDFFFREDKVAPWLSVDEFMEVITRLQLRSRVVTIARSSPYTVDECQYISWELVERLNAYLFLLYGGRGFFLT